MQRLTRSRRDFKLHRTSGSRGSPSRAVEVAAGKILVVIPRVSGDDDAQLLGVPTDRLALLVGGDVPLIGPSTDSRDAYVPCYRDRV